ncbi:MAG: protein phosphatase CheZ, partial [Alphaproteobacteria bacterium]|nr:protein phosphatase CheZ [Alphaproteobacteria bacterium]
TTPDTRLHHEILNLAQYIERFRTEIARISKGDPECRFKNMSDQLDAIIAHTDSATHTILQNLESVMDLVEKLREKAPGDADVGALCDQVFEKTTGAMEACTFQDITGQRVTKIVGSMRFVEERVNAMVGLMGKDGIEAADTSMPEEEEKPEDEMLLNGPQLPGEAISQDDIDKLFA